MNKQSLGKISKKTIRKKTHRLEFWQGNYAIAEGAGILVLEPQERVKSRDAHVYANIIGFGTLIPSLLL